MQFDRRQFLRSSVAAVASLATSPSWAADDYPSRPIRVLVGFPPGASPDITARIIGQWLSERLGQPVVIENRPGAATNIATEAVVRANPDGHTLLWVTAANASNLTLVQQPSFNFIRDIAPIARAVQVPNVLEVTLSLPVHTVPELIAYAKGNPGKLNFGSLGTGTTSHLTCALFELMTGIEMLHVPYHSSGQALTDLMSGKTQVMFDTLPQSLPHIEAGKLRALAVTTSARAETLPDLPTVSEFVPHYEASSWHGLGAPRDVPVNVIERLSKELSAGLADASLRKRLGALGATASPAGPSEFGQFIAAETAKWTKVIAAAKN